MSAVSPDYSSNRLRHRLAGEMVMLAFRRFIAVYERRYNPDQARVPAGEPGAGQWAEGGDDADGSIGSPSGQAREATTTLVGGFEPGDSDRTVQEFMSANCQGRIRSKMPSQFLEMTIGEVQELADRGNKQARTCIKIIGRDDYRK